ncbi:SDR family NAD(P)-dependent oxidoreductase [Granulosicoccus sp. 3-233]|uniref:SDR family NAD(P)-dependent oxidoreductase n=1 Tax=Granulosicoccus sp. 3-233 TaxID=3417969 RepID=UPI003D345308
MKSVAIMGGSGGIGAALIEQLLARDDIALIHASARRRVPDSAGIAAADEKNTGRLRWTLFDATDESAVESWVKGLGSVDWLINCVGLLHDDNARPEKSIGQLDPQHFLRSMQVNTLPTLLLGKHALPALRQSPAAVFASISARVGSIEDNALGGWYSYRSSKAALNMSLKCLAIEWARSASNVRVAALHPGTTDTALSMPFQRNVPAGKLFSPAKTARLLIEQIECLHDRPSGRFIAYDGEEIPW